jgi:hypothetical protein
MADVSNLKAKNIQAIDAESGPDKLLSNSITSFNFNGTILANIEYIEIKDAPIGSNLFLQSPGTSTDPVSYRISNIEQDPETLLYNVFYFSELNLYETFVERSPFRNISATIVSGVATITVPSTAGMLVDTPLEKVDGDGEFGEENPVIQSIDSLTQITLNINHQTSGSIIFNVMEETGKYLGTEKFHVEVQQLDTTSLGTEGWALTSAGQTIFTDIYARGHIEAASGFISGILEVGTNDAENSYMSIGTDIFSGEPFEDIAKQHNGIFINRNNYLLTYTPLIDRSITSVVVTNPNLNRTKKTITLNVAAHDFVLGTTDDDSIDPTEYFVLSGLTGALAELNGTQRVTALTTTSVTFEVYSDTSFNSTYTGLSASLQNFGNYDPYTCSSLSTTSVSDPVAYNLIRFNTSGNTVEVGQLIDVDGLTGDLVELNSSFQVLAATSSYIEVADYQDLITPNTYTQAGTFSSLDNETKFKVGSTNNFMKYDSAIDLLTVTGTINANAGNFTGFVTAGNMKIGKDVESTNDGVYINSTNYWYDDGKFSLGSGTKKIYFDGTDVVITSAVTIQGGVTATSFGIDANNYWNTSGNEDDFRVGNETTYMFWNKTGETTGTLQVKGEITATSGSIEGDFEVNGDAQINGSLFVGDSPVTGQRVSINDSGIVGVDSSNNTIFNLPATSNSVPTITNFNILEAKITGAGENAYLIAGTTEDPANNVIVRGDKTGGQAAAIYSTINGVATSATTGNGFYLDDTGKFRFAQGSNVISGSGGNLSVTGAINATSGNFTSTVTIGQSATQGKLQVGTSTGVGSSWFEIIGTDDKATTVIKTKDAVYQTSGVWLSADGKFSLGNALTWDGATLTISGNDGPTGIIPGNGVDVNQANEITSISGINGLTISSGLTTGARVQLDSTGLKAYNSGGTNTIAINNDGSALFTGGTSSTSTFFNATPEASLAAVGNVTSESNIIDAGSGVNFITSGFKVGMFISGTGIPSATYIVSLTSMALTISRYATADNASVTITGYNSSFGSGGSTIDNSKFRVDTFGNINASAGRLGFFTLASDGIYGTNIQITNTGMKFFDPESLLGVLPGTAGSIEAELGSNGITISTGGVFSPRGNIVPGGVSMTSPNGSLFSVYSPYYLDGFDSTTYYSGEASILNSFLITQPDIGQGSATLDFTGNLNVNSGLLRVVTTSGNGADFQSSNTASNVFLITPIEGGVRQTGNQIYFNGTTQQWVVEGDFNGANSTEIGYLAGVTSNIQTQLNSKLGGVLTASRALVTNTSGLVAVSAVTSTELGYLDGVTSAIQTQLNGKLGTTAKAADANLLDGINSTSFLRSDASDSWASATFTLKPDGATYGLVFDAGFTDTAGDPVLVSNGTAHAYGRIGRPGNRMYAGYFSVLFAGTSQITSDIREKTSIENSDLGLDFINMLRPVKYKMINGIKKQVDAEGNPVEDTPGTRWHYGLIAQEVKETLDSYNLDSAMWAVEDFETNPDGRQAISYNQIVSPLIKAVQQLSETVEVLENRLAALES